MKMCKKIKKINKSIHLNKFLKDHRLKSKRLFQYFIYLLRDGNKNDKFAYVGITIRLIGRMRDHYNAMKRFHSTEYENKMGNSCRSQFLDYNTAKFTLLGTFFGSKEDAEKIEKEKILEFENRGYYMLNKKK